LLIESFLIALLGGVCGFLIALWSRDALSILAPQNVSRFQEVSFNLPVLAFTLVIASVTAVLFGLWPAWQSSRADVQLALKGGSQGSGDAPSAKRTPQPTAAQTLSADLEVVGGDYFSTFKTPLLRGRTFNERDTKDSPRVVIIDQAMVEQYFPGEDPIGKRISVDAGNDDEGYVM